jgi:hypothetical protein
MTSLERVNRAMNFREADRVPRFISSFWSDFLSAWQKRHGALDPQEYCATDLAVVVADETAWPTRAGVVEKGCGEWVQRTGWGVLERRVHGAEFGQMLEYGIAGRSDPEQLTFDDPGLASRYERAGAQADALRDEYYVLCKTGGPYLRAAMMRGEQNFWLDVAEDPDWTRAFVDRVSEHITAVGVESLQRFGLQETGIAIYDDVAASWGPFVSPQAYEDIFLPALRRMVGAYREAGAAVVMHHADGNVLPLLDMWVDAGIDAINPVEYRAGMDPVKIRERYGEKLVCVGGLDNVEILPRGDREEVREHVRYLLQAGRGGGFIIAPHSIGPDISVETIEYVIEILDEYGTYGDVK